jgi:hypothetical protein
MTIRYLQVKKKTGRCAELYYREKSDSYQNKCSKDIYISKRKSLLIFGDSDSGKTRNLSKVYRSRKELWTKRPTIRFEALQPLTQWVEKEEVQKFFTLKTNKPFKGLQSFEKVEILLDYCREMKPIIFLEDAHKLTGRKLQIIKKATFRRIVFATALSENRIPSTIRRQLTTNVQRFNFRSDVAFDATPVLIVIICAVLAFAGMPELAVLGGILGMVARGRLGSTNV